MAFTSDLSSFWTTDLRAWKPFGTLWTQMVRWTSRRVQPDRLHPDITMEGDVATLTVDAFDSEGRFLNFLEMRATLLTPDTHMQQLRLAQTAAGKYTSHFRVEHPGAYMLTLVATSKGEAAVYSLHFGLYIATLPESLESRRNLALLQEIARMTQGTVLTGEENPFLEVAAAATYVEIWQVPAFMAVILFFLEVALYRGFRFQHMLRYSRQSTR